MMEDQVLGQVGALGSAMADVAVQRERNRRHRLRRTAALLSVVAVWLLVRSLFGNSVVLGRPQLPAGLVSYFPAFLLVLLLGGRHPRPDVRGGPFAARALPVRARSTSRSTTSKGAGVVVDEVVKTLNLFLASQDLPRADGRHVPGGRSCSRGRRAPARPTWPRRWRAKRACRSCSCRRRRSSRCTTARPTARSAPTSRRCASAARQEGGAIGFIEEIDAIGAARYGHGRLDGRARASPASSTSSSSSSSRSTQPTDGAARAPIGSIERLNRWLPAAPPAQSAAPRSRPTSS